MKGALLLALAGLSACAAHAPPPQTPVSPPPATPPPPAPAPPILPRSLAECRSLLVAHAPLDEEQRCFAGVATKTLDERTARDYLEITALLYAHDYPHAAHVFDELLAQIRATPQSAEREGWVHNGLTWVHWGAGNAGAALEENRLLKVSADALSGKTQRQLLLHYWWDRAALLVEDARTDPSLRKQADEARAAYRKLAHPRQDHDGLAVLDAFFAYCDHHGAVARKAAETVNVDEDGDVQDLYILALAIDAGGDAKRANAICQRVAAANEYPMKPLVLDRMSNCHGPLR